MGKARPDGRWAALLEQIGVPVAPLRPANCGFNVRWSEHLRERFVGQPVKPVLASFTDVSGVKHERLGELMITENGVEGSLIYALSAALRDAIEQPRRHAKPRLATRSRPATGDGRGRTPARLALVIQPPAKPFGAQGQVLN